MKIKHQAIKIPAEEGTDPFENCKLERKKYADVLTDIASTYADGFVLAVNNEWGAGKTTFVKMWRQSLDNQKIKTLYYNAWENDFEKDVLVALISELKELENTATEKFKKVVDKAAPLTLRLLPSLVKGVAGKLTGDDFVKELITELSEASAEGLKEEIKTYTKRKKGLQDFKESLKKFIKEASPGKPVIFFIDELDRCRPNFAVEVLETVKHLFSVPGIVFVLSMDRNSLGHAIRGVYGSDRIDANEYLRRFIDVEFNLPLPNYEKSVKYFSEYFQLEKFFKGRDRSFFYDEQDFINFARHLLFITNLNFRQQEKLFSHIKLALSVSSKGKEIYPPSLILLSYLRLFKNSLYCEITEKKLTAQALFNKFEDLLPDNFNLSKGEVLLSSFLLTTDLYNNSIGKSQLLIRNGPDDYQVKISSKIYPDKDLRKVMRDLQDKYWYGKNGLDELLYKIELLEPFQNE